MKEHFLKTNSKYFKQIASGNKLFEFRINDRNFAKGDLLNLMNYNQKLKKYSKGLIIAEVTYILPISEFISLSNYVVMSISIKKISLHTNNINLLNYLNIKH